MVSHRRAEGRVEDRRGLGTGGWPEMSSRSIQRGRWIERFQPAKRIALVLLPGLLASCGPPTSAPPAAPRRDEVKTSGPRTYPLSGVVRQVNRETGVVAIRHEAIPGFMPEMTMPFDLNGQEVL